MCLGAGFYRIHRSDIFLVDGFGNQTSERTKDSGQVMSRTSQRSRSCPGGPKDISVESEGSIPSTAPFVVIADANRTARSSGMRTITGE
jgi:hypothetical protein